MCFAKFVYKSIVPKLPLFYHVNCRETAFINELYNDKTIKTTLNNFIIMGIVNKVVFYHTSVVEKHTQELSTQRYFFDGHPVLSEIILSFQKVFKSHTDQNT